MEWISRSTYGQYKIIGLQWAPKIVLWDYDFHTFTAYLSNWNDSNMYNIRDEMLAASVNAIVSHRMVSVHIIVLRFRDIFTRIAPLNSSQIATCSTYVHRQTWYTHTTIDKAIHMELLD